MRYNVILPPPIWRVGEVQKFLKVPQKFRSTPKIFVQKLLSYPDPMPENLIEISAGSRLMSIF